MVREGETYKIEGITIEIVEVNPYYSFSGMRNLMIAYRIKDGNYVSPVAHFWMMENEDIRTKLKEIIDHYLSIKKSLRI